MPDRDAPSFDLDASWRISLGASATTRTSPTLEPGRVLGDFELIEAIGSGSFGAVWRARQARLGRDAAVKVLHPTLASTAAERFLAEARLAARLEHPGAARVYAAGVEGDGTSWIAMEWVRGTSLARLLELRGALDPAQVVPMVARLAEVVQAAHTLGIVHRDLKPANVMVQPREGMLVPTLLDLGLARELDVGEAPDRPEEVREGTPSWSLTLAGTVLGSPRYMAPEQWTDAHAAGPAADQYALAVLTWECLTGTPPYVAETLAALATAHRERPVPRLPAHLPRALDAVLARALAKDPLDRYPDVAAFGAALGACADVAPVRPLAGPVADRLRREGPQPIAEALLALDAAPEDPRVAADLDDAIGRVLGTLALAARRQRPALADAPEVADALAALEQRTLTTEEWYTLVRGVVRPHATQPELWPLPGLVGALAEEPPDLAGPDRLAARVERLGFLTEMVLLVFVASGVAESWSGPARRGRARLRVVGPDQPIGTVALGDRDGRLVLVLSPLAEVGRPAPGEPEEVFWPEGTRGGAFVRRSWPTGYHRFTRAGPGDGPVSDERAPFPGLIPYTAADAGVYVGRESAVEEAANRLRKLGALVVVGPSGIGKSSFVIAGVAPAAGLDLRVIRPGRRPLDTLAEVPDGAALLVDQAEELVTLGGPLVAFAEALLARVHRGWPVLVTLRADFLAEAEPLLARLERLGPTVLLLGVPGEADLVRVLAEPLAKVGYRFEDPAAPARLAAEVAGLPAALPLLAFVGAELWVLRDPVLRQIPARATAGFGGVAGALGRHAETTLQAMPERDRPLVRAAVRRLVSPAGTRVPVPRADLEAALGARVGGVLDRLLDARLLVVGEAGIELAHEALVRTWPRLGDWISEDLEDRRIHAALTQAARAWSDASRSGGLLWRGDVLAELRGWRTRAEPTLTPVEAAFAEASTAAEARAARRRRGLVASIVVGSLLAAVGLGWLAHRSAQAEADAEAARARTAATLLDATFENGRRYAASGDLGRALPYLAEAWRGGMRTPAMRYLLGEARRTFAAEVASLPPRGPVQRADWDPSGERVIACGNDGVYVWPVGGEPLPLLGHKSSVGICVFSGDGRHVLTRDADLQVRAFDAETGAATPLDVPAPNTVTIGASDAYLLGVTQVDRIDLATGRPLQSIPGRMGRPTAAPNRARFAGLTDDGVLVLWDPELARVRQVDVSTEGFIVSTAFDPTGERVWLRTRNTHAAWVDWDTGRLHTLDAGCNVRWVNEAVPGEVIVTGYAGCGISLWDLATGKKRATLAGSAALQPTRAIGSADGTVWMVVDGTLHAWDHAGDALPPFALPAGSSEEVPVDPRGRVLVHDPDGRLRVYAPLTLVPETRPLPAARCDTQYLDSSGSYSLCVGTNTVRRIEVNELATGATLGVLETALQGGSGIGMAIARGGRPLVVSGAKTGEALVWNPGEEPRPLPTAASGVLATIATASTLATGTMDGTITTYDPDGVVRHTWPKVGYAVVSLAAPDDARRIAFGTFQGRIGVLDPAADTPLWTSDAHTRAVYFLGFSPDGTRLYSGGKDGVARIWDVETGRESAALPGHVGGAWSLIEGTDGLAYTCGLDGPGMVWDPVLRRPLGRFGRDVEYLNRLANGDVLVQDAGRMWALPARGWEPAADELDDFVRCHVPLRLEDGGLVETPSRCPDEPTPPTAPGAGTTTGG